MTHLELRPVESRRGAIKSGPACGPILLTQAGAGFLAELELQGQHLKKERFAHLLQHLDEHLGRPAPLLAYTKLTGETWRQALPAPEQEDAARFLEEFRAYLRTFGWLDAARPINQFD